MEIIKLRNIALISPFIFLILVGIAYQLDIMIINISVVTLSLYVLFAVSFFWEKIGVVDDSKKFLLSMDLLFIYIFLSVVLGLVLANSVEDIKQDVIGFIHLGIVYYCAKKLELTDIHFVWKAIVIISSFAVLKILYINFSDVPVEWTNVWQARKDPLPGLDWNRIVLNGGDIYLTLSLISIFTFMIFKSKSFNSIIAIMVFIVLAFAVFISLSRSSYMAVGAGFVSSLFIALFQREVPAKKVIITIIGIILISASFVYYTSDALDVGSIYLARIDAYDAEGGSLMWREVENESVFKEIKKSWLFGNGMGATYNFFVEKSERVNDTNIFTHNFITWILLKLGIIGLTLVLIFFAQIVYLSQSFIKLSSVEKETKILLVAFTSSFIGLIVISILANKMFYTEGSMFLGLYLALLYKLSIASNSNKIVTVSK